MQSGRLRKYEKWTTLNNTPSKNDPFMTDHKIVGHGATLEACFADIASSLFTQCKTPSSTQPRAIIFFKFKASGIEPDLATWLYLLGTHAKALKMNFSQFQLNQCDDQWLCEVAGEPIQEAPAQNTQDLNLKVLSAQEVNGQWEIQCQINLG